MSKQGGAAKFGAWLAGIAATVISGYLLWYFTVPKPAVVTTFEGMVYSGDAPVAKAMVSLNLTGTAGAGGPIVDFTDDNGAYKFELTGLPQNTGATLNAMANGYEETQPHPLPMPLQADIRQDIPLTPLLAAGAPPPTPGPLAGGGSGAKQMAPAVRVQGSQQVQTAPAIAHIPAYVPKIASLAKQVRIGK